MPVNQARVKSVLSGDTLVLTAVNNPSQERTLSLAFVSAPRMRREGDEPFAFESRDFLRRLVVGKIVQFHVLYTIPTGVKRDYGIITLSTGQSLPEQAVAEGWVKLRDDAGRKDESDEAKALLEKLELQEAKAKADSKGLWASGGGRIEVSYDLPDPKAFATEWKGKSVDAIVEKVLTGDRVIARLLLSPTKHVQCLVLIAGIRAPTTKRTNPSDGKEQPAEPHGEEAQQFVETRLLQRNVRIDVLGISPQNQLIGAVKHPNGSIAEFVLKAGLARCTDHHSTMLGGDMAALRQAEKQAKEQKLGLFKDHVAPKGSASTDKDAVVTRVQSADTIYIRHKTGGEKRINLSSVRQPKPTDPKQAPFSAEAKDFLRKKLIGKHVRVNIDGTKAASEGYEERDVATVMVNNKNVALMLIEAGYASVIRHRRDDPDRSPDYDALLAAEEEAQKAQKGMWSSKAPAAKTYQDYSENLQKAKIQASVLQRQKKIPAVVDFVKSGSRFTILVPRENAKLTFVLSGIRAPKSARNANDKAEPFGQEAHDFAARRCMQRDVEIDVENTDKVGGFIGTLYVNRENFAKLLLEEGLASVHGYSAEQSGNARELYAAEQKAKDARKGMWHDWDPSKEEQGDETGATHDDTGVNGSTNGTPSTTATTPHDPSHPTGAADLPSRPKKAKKDYRDVLLTHIDPATGHLKLQLIGPHHSDALTELMRAFQAHHASGSHPSLASASPPPKAGDHVAARFSADGEWYRARIRRVERDARRAEVVYIDYGNSESVGFDGMRALTQPRFSPSPPSGLAPQAVDAVLSFVRLPHAERQKEYLADAVAFVAAAAADDRPLVALVDHADPALLHVALLDPDKLAAADDELAERAKSLNADLVAAGLATVPSAKSAPAWQRAFGEAHRDVLRRRQEDEARKERRGMWEYGDLTGEDDEEDDKEKERERDGRRRK